jgi:hypothetical protein
MLHKVNLSYGLCASQRVDVDGGIVYRVEHHETLSTPYLHLYQRTPPTFRMVVPGIPKASDAHDNIADILPVQPMPAS